jgi:acetyl-CoA synthetase
MTETFNIGLGNNDNNLRKKADSDFVSFWDDQAKNLSWFSPWEKVLDWRPPFAKWFVGGTINASYNALDIHQTTKSEKSAILWEGENGESRNVTYGEMFVKVQKFANVLKSLGVKKGDRVTIYLPMVPELPIAMLACARIGAIHTVIFSGFSATSIKDRVTDSKSKVIVTADGGYRRGKIVKLKDVIDDAIKDIDFVEHVVVLERTKNTITMTSKDKLWNELMDGASDSCPAEKLPSDHPLYILYTSGTTGKPKGVLHGTGGYLTHLHSTFKWAFDIKDSDIFFCTADIGWVTGHSYVVYAPFLHGTTQVMYEGSPDFPDASRMWDILQKYKVTIFYTTPTALRMFMKFGDDIPGTLSIPGVNITVVDENGDEVAANTKGYLVIKNPWPGMLLTLWHDDEKYKTVYWSKYENCYYPGDYALKDDDGYLWLLGRADDVLKIAGHRIGTAELESCMVSHPDVAESAACGIPDEIKGEVIIVFVVLNQGVVNDSDVLEKQLVDKIRTDIGAIATPKQIYFVSKLPKTRSGKIMRRLLKAIGNNEQIGDVSTLEDGAAVTEVQQVFDELQKSIKENLK